VYCAGIPAASFYLLRKHKPEIEKLRRLQSQDSEHPESRLLEGSELPKEIKELQELQGQNPMLRGLAPLYQDYKAEFYYFEVVQFVVTLFLVAVAASLPVNSGSVVFLALMASGGMLLFLCGFQPYVDDGDNRDAVISQITITLTLCVGLLSLTAMDEDPQDWAFGWLLVFFTTVAVSAPFGMILRLGTSVLVVYYGGDPDTLPAWMKCMWDQVLNPEISTRKGMQSSPASNLDMPETQSSPTLLAYCSKPIGKTSKRNSKSRGGSMTEFQGRNEDKTSSMI